MDFFDLDAVLIDAALPLPELLRSVERQIADAPVEVSFAFDEAGKLLFRIGTGQRDRIGYSADELRQMKDAILTHNHPLRGGLSVVDILFAHEWNLGEIRAVAGEVVHRLRRPSTGWDVAYCRRLYEIGRRRTALAPTNKQKLEHLARWYALLINGLSLSVITELI